MVTSFFKYIGKYLLHTYTDAYISPRNVGFYRQRIATAFYACAPKKMAFILLIVSLITICMLFTGSSASSMAALQEVEPEAKHELIEVIATGYTAGVESTGKRPGHPQYGITYSGVKVRRDQVSTIAADPKLFPIGTLLYIPGYGYGVVADTGSAIKGNRIDLYFETIKEVYAQWGKRKVHVQVLRRGSGKLTQAWLNNINEAIEVGKPIPQSYLES